MVLAKNLCILILLCSLWLDLSCQEKWSLEKCIDYAIKNNIQLKQQKLNSDMYHNNLFQSSLNFLPSINAYANHNNNYGRKVDAFTNEFSASNTVTDNFSLVSSLTLFNGFKNINTYSQAHYNFLASLQDLEKAKNDIALNIAASFLQVLFSDELLQVAKNQADITKQQVERSKLLYNEGSVAQDKLLEIESQLATDEYQVVTSENQLNMSYLTLVQLLDVDSVNNFKIDEPQINVSEENMLKYDMNSIYRGALDKLPQIKSAEFKLKASEKNLALARGVRYPVLTLNGSIGSGYSDARKDITGSPIIGSQLSGYATDQAGNLLGTVYSYTADYNYKTRSFNNQMNDNMSKSFYFSLNIPIFNGWQVNNSVSNAKLTLLNSQYNLDLSRKQLFKDIQQAYSDALAALNKYTASKKSVSAIEESFTFTQKKYELGLINYVDYIVAVNSLTKAKSDLLQAKYEYVFKLKILDFYQGNPIKL